jgi:serine/threonine protein kinase
MAPHKILRKPEPPAARRDRKPGDEPVPGYRLLEPLGRGGFGEVWKCEAPGGLLKAIKFVKATLDALHGDSASAEEELKAIERVKAIRHPFLLSMERVEHIGSDLVIVLELADQNLHALLQEYRQKGQGGIPRDDLLALMREAAEALDVLNVRHSLLHLDVKPQNLFLLGGHVKVGDFGLVKSTDPAVGSCGGTMPLEAITPLYAAPELFLGTTSRFSDQYSLAVVYQELLTGTLPFRGKGSRQLMLRHLQDEPDLSALQGPDRTAVARALTKEPEGRFPSCAAFVRALAPGRALSASSRPPSCSAFSLSVEEFILPPSASALTEAVADQQLLSPIASTPLWEVWQALGPDGDAREVRIIFGFSRPGANQEAKALARLHALRHPVLAPIDVVQQSPGRLVLSAPIHEKSLRERFRECKMHGLPGIPRDELLRYLHAAAKGLDELFQEQGLHHLLLNPRNLLLDGGRLQIADFGLAQLLWLPAGQDVFPLDARYGSPELFHKQVSPTSDQYSLALIYYDLLTGGLRRNGTSGARTIEALELDCLSPAESSILARALDPAPNRRWESCLAFIQALQMANAPTSSSQIVINIAEGGSGVDASFCNGPAASGILRMTFTTGLPRGVLEMRLDGFRGQWEGRLLHRDDQDFIFHVKTPRSFWQRWLGRHPGLKVHIRVASPAVEGSDVGHVTVRIQPHELGRSEGAEALQVIGLLLLESLRNHLQVTPRRRGQERLLWPYEFDARPIFSDGRQGQAIRCRGNDISMTGIGFRAPRELPASQLNLQLPQTPQTPAVEVSARVVRSGQREDGWWEVGAVLLAPVARTRA